MTEEQIKAHKDFFARRYNIDICKASRKQSTPQWCNKKIIQENCSGEPFKMIIFTPSSEFMNETVEYLSPVKNSCCLEVKVVSKMGKKFVLKSRLDLMSCLKNHGGFQNVPKFPLFY